MLKQVFGAIPDLRGGKIRPRLSMAGVASAVAISIYHIVLLVLWHKCLGILLAQRVFWFYVFIDFREGKMGKGEKETSMRNMDQLPPAHPPLGFEPATSAWDGAQPIEQHKPGLKEHCSVKRPYLDCSGKTVLHQAETSQGGRAQRKLSMQVQGLLYAHFRATRSGPVAWRCCRETRKEKLRTAKVLTSFDNICHH